MGFKFNMTSMEGDKCQWAVSNTFSAIQTINAVRFQGGGKVNEIYDAVIAGSTRIISIF